MFGIEDRLDTAGEGYLPSNPDDSDCATDLGVPWILDVARRTSVAF